MQYTVFLRQRSTGIYEATTPALPGSMGKGKTRDEALDRLKNVIEEWLAETEMTTIEVDTPASGSKSTLNPGLQNPWLTTAGIFKDDPLLNPMLHQIYAARDTEKQAE